MVQDRIKQYFDRNPRLHVLFIFDQMDYIGAELADAVWEDGYVYKRFDGTWFGTKRDIETTWKDKRGVLLFSEALFPQTEEQMLRFPLLGLLRANMEYKGDDYATFMQQYHLPDKYAPYIRRHEQEIGSTRMLAVLSGYLSPEVFNEDVANRAFVSVYLGEKKLLEWHDIIVRMVVLGLSTEAKKRTDFFVKLQKNLDANKAVNSKLLSIFGVSYQPNQETKMKQMAEAMKYNAITQLLDENKADDYKVYKIKNSVQLEQLNKVMELGRHDRQLSGKFSAAIDELASGIREEEIIRIYGVDAEYFYMTERLCYLVLTTIMQERLTLDPQGVNEKMRELAMKLPEHGDIQQVLKFVENLALYYDRVRNVGTLRLKTPQDYVDSYVGEWYQVDLFYRRSLRSYHELMTKETPIEREVRQAKDLLDKDYAKQSNVMNLEWLACVNERSEHFGAVALPRQEDFFETYLDKSTKKVVIVVDALRYEVATELMESLGREKHIATLGAMRAVLPTETKFGKLVLLPHHDLELQGAEMLVDGKSLITTEARTSHVDGYREGAVCVSYEEVMNGHAQSMRDLFKRPLVYIYYNTLDEVGHSQSPFEVISACDRAVEQLTVLVRRLHATWNVTNVYITSDHGFIYNDMHFEDKDKHSITDECVEKKTRYYLTTDARPVEGICKYPLREVSSIRSAVPTYVAVPQGTNRLAASGGYNFAHGGATLQEMIIPMIHSLLKREEKTERVGVNLLGHNLQMVSSQLRLQLIQTEAVSMTVIKRTVCCQLFDGSEPVTTIKELTLDSTDAVNLNNRLYDITLNLCKTGVSSMLQLRVWDKDDALNPLIKETVRNNTLIEQDF